MVAIAPVAVVVALGRRRSVVAMVVAVVVVGTAAFSGAENVIFWRSGVCEKKSRCMFRGRRGARPPFPLVVILGFDGIACGGAK